MKTILFTLLLVAFTSVVSAQAPSLINYQGRLTDTNGAAITGSKNFSISIYDAATEGSLLYTETIGAVILDANGVYSFQFGTKVAELTSALQDNSEHWIELSVNNGVLSPRQRILAVPFALNAAKAEIATRAESVGDEDGNVNIAGSANVTGAATFTGPVMIADNASIQQDLNVAGSLNAQRLNLEGPFGDTNFDGLFNRIAGMETIFEGDYVTFSNLTTRFSGPEVRFEGHDVEFWNDRTTFEGELRINGSVTSDGGINVNGSLNAQRLNLEGPLGDTNFDGLFNRIAGMETIFEGDYVEFRNNHTTFENEVSINGPVTEPKHATTKEYVDALSARSVARVAALANVDLQNASPEIDGVILAAGDRVLLAGQTSAAENGLYVADANGALTRASDFDAANEIDGGAHLFIQEGSQAGQGYVLADLGENFELGTGALSFSRFTVDPTQSLALGNDLNVAGSANVNGAATFTGPVMIADNASIQQDLNVAGSLNAQRLNLEGPFGDTNFDGLFNRIAGMETIFEGDYVTFSNLTTRFSGPEVRFEGHDVEFWNDRTTFEGELRINGPVTEPKHATTKEYVDARIDTETARALTEETILMQIVQQQAALIQTLEARVTALENR